MELGVDLPCVNKVKAVKVGQNVGCLLKWAMELSEGNRGLMEESSLIGVRMHLEVQRPGWQAVAAGGWRRCQHFMSGRCIRAEHAIELAE